MACAIIKSGISPCLLGRIGVSTVQPVRTAMRQIRVLQRREPPRDKKVKQVIMHKDVISAFQRDQMLEKDSLDRDRLEEILREQEGGQTRAGLEDMPIFGMDNPYEKPPKKCLLCEHNVSLDYKNVRLLSQFVSPHTGQIYGRHITGLCLYVQRRISKLIARARYLGFMPYTMKEPRYMRDPKLYDPFGRR